MLDNVHCLRISEKSIQFFPYKLLSVICKVHCRFPTLRLYENFFNLSTCDLCNSILHFCVLSISSFLLDYLHPPASESIPSISPIFFCSVVHSSIDTPDIVPTAMIPGTMHMSRILTSFEAIKFRMVWKVPC